MQGIQGTLVRKNNSLRFVITIELINQNASVEVNAKELELVEECVVPTQNCESPNGDLLRIAAPKSPGMAS
jgi:hypothetical protein